ncbi:MAG: hypothetical protein QOE22_553 [Candidatus Parcubacteria bacterium]|jgi:glycosyltransferase involved in cell wall biosynthesis|nr:hypothetical protein [Candidatus Parcubacteria bacterium]
MKLLFVTQVVDRNDGVLGAYHGWLTELAKHTERIEVICLYEGEHDLPANVTVHSLGKESLSSRRKPLHRLLYVFRFKRLAWTLRHDYDAVFVHMNQEYLLIAGPFWKLLGKRIYMWRNHYAGSWLTDIAAAFCTKIFSTSRHSYTARYRKNVLMPVGIDTSLFRPDTSMARKPRSILFLARMTPSKNPLMLIEALRELKEKRVPFTATFVGSPPPEHEAYYRSLAGRAEHYGIAEYVTFLPNVSNRETPDLYRAHEVFVNCSRSGMFDKTIFEAVASGCVPFARSRDWEMLVGDERLSFAENGGSLAARLAAFFSLGETEQEAVRDMLAERAVAPNALSALIVALEREMGLE